MANLNYSVALNLVTKGFNKGANEIKAGFRSIRMQMLALSGLSGLTSMSLTDMVNKILDTSKETAAAAAQLKIASGSTKDYAQNLKFVNTIAKETGQYINDVTLEYARFAKASSAAGMTTKQSQQTFEDVKSAMAGMKLSTDDSAAVMESLQKVMVKGKFSTRDFLLGVVMKMPSALQAMADALGVSTDKVRELVAKGKVGAEVLPKFAAALKLKAPKPDLSSIAALQNDIKNKMQELFNQPAFLNGLKSMLKMGAAIIGAFATHIKEVVSALITYIVATKFRVLISAVSSSFSGITATATRAFAIQQAAAGTTYTGMAAKARIFGNGVVLTFRSMATKIKGLLASIGLFLFIDAAIGAYQRWKDVIERTAKAKGDLAKIKDPNLGNTEQVKDLQKSLSVVNNINASLKSRLSALADINKQLGTNYTLDKHTLTLNKEVTKEIQNQIEALKSRAAIQSLTDIQANEQSQAEDDINSYMADYPAITRGNIYAGVKSYSRYRNSGKGRGSDEYGKYFEIKSSLARKDGGFNNIMSNFDDLMEKLYNFNYNNAKINNRIAAEKNKLGNVLSSGNGGGGGTGGTGGGATNVGNGGGGHTETELEKIQNTYWESLTKLNAQKEHQQIQEQEYNKQFDDLIKATQIEIATAKEKATKNSQFAKDIDNLAKSPKYDKAEDEVLKAKFAYKASTNKTQALYDNGLITKDEFYAQMNDALKSAIDAVIAYTADGVKSAQDFVDALKIELKKYTKKTVTTAAPDLKNRDTTFDYKLTPAEISSENLDNVKENIATLQEYINQHKDDLNAAIDDAQKKLTDLEKSVPDLEKAMKLEKIKEDLKDIKKQASGFRIAEGTVSAMASLYSTAKGLRETLASKDSTMLDKVFASLDAAMSAVNTIQQLVDMINEFQKARKALQAVEKAAAAADTTNTVTEVANSEAKTAANAGEAASGAMKAHSSIPFVGIALGLAGVAAIIAAIASAKKRYATGGIIGGSSNTGDNMLARVNAGEMILNPSQQSRLFAIANGASAGNTQAPLIVSHKIKGSDLYLAIENYKHINKR